MGLFYVYYRDACSSPERAWSIAFPNRETADEWWRSISTPYSCVERFSPQLYVKTSPSNPSSPSIFASEFSNKMFVTPLDRGNKGYSVALPPVAITDHVSGEWYFIRSKADSWSHWYLRIQGECLVCGSAGCDAIHVSSEHRTRFCVRVRDPANDSKVPDNFVMIARDAISIAALKGYSLHISDCGDLKATKGYHGETDLLFGDLKKRFITRAEKQVNGEIWEYVESVERGVGEPWELID